jgi:serine phosphatase RsbU (regulator of sigma subunit)
MLDEDRVFFLVGDVSGKGLEASIFMAVSKALCKSAALRCGRRIDELLREANAEIGRENSEGLYVTVFAGVLDARTGRLEYCNAGHPPPFVLAPDGGVTPLAEGGGPPLCVLDGFACVSAAHALEAGGCVRRFRRVTEAMNAAGQLYGAEKLEAALRRSRQTDGPQALVDAIKADVARFVGGAEVADDLTLLVLRWNGSSGR